MLIMRVFYLALLILFFGLHFSSWSHSAEIPEWRGNDIGRERVVLPGFQPISCEGETVKLFGREYIWQNSYLPVSIVSRGVNLVKGMVITLKQGDESYQLQPSSVEVISCNDHDAEIVAKGVAPTGINVVLKAYIEYDGLIKIQLSLDSKVRPIIDELELSFLVNRQVSSQVMAFSAKGIRRQKDRSDLIDLPYKGDFLNAVSMSDGDRSFWWIADHANNWVMGRKSATVIQNKGESIELVQRLVSNKFQLNERRVFEFALLATPIKAVDASRRTERVIWGPVKKRYVKNGGTFKLWWPSAFMYDALPLVEYEEELQGKLSVKDRMAYPGLAKNKKKIESDRENFGVHWIPYFSAHVLSEADPVLEEFLDIWKIMPERTFRDGLNPYSNQYDKPVLSHRAKDYTDYLIWRLSNAIAALNAQGIYLDHSAVHDSNNISHTGAFDENGLPLTSLDILATRDFFKRLSTLFYTEGRLGYVFAHISNREIIPAYTFAYGLVDGEQFSKKVKQGEYLSLMPLNEFRARFAGGQYGLQNYWLPLDWVSYGDDPTWQNSERQKLAYRRVQSLALLHDVPLWPHGVHREERQKILTLVDDFGIESSVFTGYWSGAQGIYQPDSRTRISKYQRGNKILRVISNISHELVKAGVMLTDDLNDDCQKEEWLPELSDGDISRLGSQFQISIPPMDFVLIATTARVGCNVGKTRS